MTSCGNLSAPLEAFFTERLIRQRQASPHTVASYRDTFRLLLKYAQEQIKKAPSDLCLDDIDAPFVARFLDHLEKDRGNRTRSRNARLAAIHSFFRFLAFQEPGYSLHIQRVLAIPSKKHERPLIAFLTRPEIDALLAAPDRRTWAGTRDHALLLVAVQTGLRVSELVSLRCADVLLGTGAHVRCLGKGRKERATPLTKQAQAVLQTWLKLRAGSRDSPLFPNARGGKLSRDGVEYLLERHVAKAREFSPSLARKRVSAHVLRHTTAVQLLQAGVDRSVIALWLGHESVETTQIYLDADLAIKEEILEKTVPLGAKSGRFRPDDSLLAFLSGL